MTFNAVPLEHITDDVPTLTLNSYIPGHVHAFYLEYVYYDRRERLRQGGIVTDRAPGVYSNNVQNGGNPHGYGTIVQPNAA